MGREREERGWVGGEREGGRGERREGWNKKHFKLLSNSYCMARYFERCNYILF